jgi:hypothetical protein
MSVLNPGGISKTPSTSLYYNNVAIGAPVVREAVVESAFKKAGSAFLAHILGKGDIITLEALANNPDMHVADDEFRWYVREDHERPVTFGGTPLSANGANNSNVVITLSENDGYLGAGYVIEVEDKATGTVYPLAITSAGTLVSGTPDTYTYNSKLLTGDSTLTIPHTTIVASGDEANVRYIENGSDCNSEDFATAIVTTPALHVNKMMEFRFEKPVCKSGVQKLIWFEGEKGQKFYMADEEMQYETDAATLFANKAIRAHSTYISGGTGTSALPTNAAGSQLASGSGYLEQIPAINNETFDISTYINQPANYQAFANLFEEWIMNWAQRIDMVEGVINVYTTPFFIRHLQEVYKERMEGGVNNVEMSKKDGMVEQVVINNVVALQIGKFYLKFYHEATFFPKGMAANSLDKYRAVLAVDETPDGEAIAALHFRGGGGIDDNFKNRIIPGTIDPTGRNIAVNKKR